MRSKSENTLIIQSDKSLLLDVESPFYENARDEVSKFAELEKSLEYIHTYRITPLSLWNAAAAGLTFDDVVTTLKKYSKYAVPSTVENEIRDYVSRFGMIVLRRDDNTLVLEAKDPSIIKEIFKNKRIKPHIIKKIDNNVLSIDPKSRGDIKRLLTELGYPADDLAGYEAGEELRMNLLNYTVSSNCTKPFKLREYQKAAVNVFYQGGRSRGGCGTIVLPCGAGKTMVGLGVMSFLKCYTLILCPNTIGVRQWIEEILDKTTLTEEEVGEYTGQRKEIKPVTVSTYQILTWNSPRQPDFPHLHLFEMRNWGLIIYDEVHLLPAPVFRVTARIQATRRLGLTATLVREDGRERDVFSLVGPKRYDVSWRVLEQQGWIANARCHEIRIDMLKEVKEIYKKAEHRKKYRIAAENPLKLEVLKEIVDYHGDDNKLIIGMYLAQLEKIAKMFDAPIITGRTPRAKREQLYDRFRSGDIRLLVVSKVANFALDLPDANVAIQVSGTFGSRQEEAQRLGRILRPKKDGSPAYFYSVVSRGTKDQDYAEKRQLFLIERGYNYTITDRFVGK